MGFLTLPYIPLVIISLGICSGPATLSKYLDVTAMKFIPKATKIIPTILNKEPKIPSISGWVSKGADIIGTIKINILRFFTHVPVTS